MSEFDDSTPRTHYHYSISLRVSHPSADPDQITEALGIYPIHCWKAGEPRQTPKGVPLDGTYKDTYWVADVVAGRWPVVINQAIHDVLKKLVRYRAFFHQIRSEGGAVEFFIGWCFENQSGDILTHQCLALAGDLQIDLHFDVYPPDQPQNEIPVGDPIAWH